MVLDWVTALDMCAANGIIDYDAPADILGQQPRYVGHPNFETLPLSPTALLPEGTKLPQSPQGDEFISQNGNLVENPSWKKWLFGLGTAGVIGGSILAALVRKGTIKIPAGLKNIDSTVLTKIKTPFVWIASKFKKAPTP